MWTTDTAGGAGSPVGRLTALTVYPLKSARGVTVSQSDVVTSGLDGDRAYAVVGRDGEVRSAKDLPGLAGLVASVREDHLLVGPDDASLEAALPALRGLLGDDIDVVRHGAHHQVAPVHLVSVGAANAAAAPTGCDPDPRANLLVELEEPGAERGWVGAQIQVGDTVLLQVERTPRRCLGVYCSVLVSGRVQVGDEVHLRTPSPPGRRTRPLGGAPPDKSCRPPGARH